jgi:hypothetical protein
MPSYWWPLARIMSELERTTSMYFTSFCRPDSFEGVIDQLTERACESLELRKVVMHRLGAQLSATVQL